MQILTYAVEDAGYKLAPAAEAAARRVLEDAWRKRTKSFGNERRSDNSSKTRS